MKKVAITLTAVAALLLAFLMKARQYYGLASRQPSYSCEHPSADTLRIAFIGDSWAFLHQPYDDSLALTVSRQTGHPVKVCSYGLCGMTSKEVYLSMFQDTSLRRLVSQGVHCCIVSVGINDSYKKMSPDYYVYHTLLIARLLIDNGITPVLMEIPCYDVALAYERQTAIRKLLRRLSMLVTGSPIDCLAAYRQTLRSSLQVQQLSSQVLLLPAMPADWSLWQPDRMHLNEKGYARLDACIATILSNAQESVCPHPTSSSAGRESQ